MNVHKKLLGMGFKRCKPHMKHSENWNTSYKMVKDEHEMKYQTINGKSVYMQVKKEHPKWRLFYKMIFTDNINIWVDTHNGKIKTIWLEGNIAKNGVEEIYEYYKQGSILLESKKDIIRLFPNSIKRDFIINDLFS